jgi:hypothetical protein
MARSQDALDDFGEDINWKQLKSPDSYYPTRLEYLAGKALQGLVTGRSDKTLGKASHLAELAVGLGKALGEACDKAQD